MHKFKTEHPVTNTGFRCHYCDGWQLFKPSLRERGMSETEARARARAIFSDRTGGHYTRCYLQLRDAGQGHKVTHTGESALHISQFRQPVGTSLQAKHNSYADPGVRSNPGKHDNEQ